jgi:hypothetical protein
MIRPIVSPTPEQLFGFPTLEESQEAQRICLESPTIEEANRFIQSLAPHIRSGRIIYIRPDNPEPPTRGVTAWLDVNPDKLD